MNDEIDTWTPDLVRERLVKAAKIVERGGRVGPKGFGNAWPEMSSEWGDLLAMVETDEIHKGRNVIRIAPSARDVTLAYEALSWASRYLEGQDGPKRCLKLYLFSKARRKTFTAVCRKKGIAIATAKRGRAKALSLIAQGLANDAVTIEL